MARKESKVEYLPEEVIVAALEYAYKVEGTSHMLTSEQVRNRVYRRMGWELIPCQFSDEEWAEEIRLSEESGFVSHEEVMRGIEKMGLNR